MNLLYEEEKENENKNTYNSGLLSVASLHDITVSVANGVCLEEEKRKVVFGAEAVPCFGPLLNPTLTFFMLFQLICFPSCYQSTVGKDGAVMGVTVTRMSMNLHTQVLSQACSYTEGRCIL